CPRTAAVFVEKSNGAVRSVEPERAAAGQDDAVHSAGIVRQAKEIGLARPGCGAALRDAGDGAAVHEHDGAASRTFGERVVSDADAWNRRDGVVSRVIVARRLQPSARERLRDGRREHQKQLKSHHEFLILNSQFLIAPARPYLFRSRAAGIPAAPVACVAARTTASAMASAASAPIVVMSALPSQR